MIHDKTFAFPNIAHRSCHSMWWRFPIRKQAIYINKNHLVRFKKKKKKLSSRLLYCETSACRKKHLNKKSLWIYCQKPFQTIHQNHDHECQQTQFSLIYDQTFINCKSLQDSINFVHAISSLKQWNEERRVIFLQKRNQNYSIDQLLKNARSKSMILVCFFLIYSVFT